MEQEVYHKQVASYYAGDTGYNISCTFQRLCPCCGKGLAYDYRILSQGLSETRYNSGYYCDCGYDERTEACYTVYPNVSVSAGWQTCPHCEGSGQDKNFLMDPCPVCKGHRIIGISDGMPPV